MIIKLYEEAHLQQEIGPLHQQLREALLYISNTIVQECVQKLSEVAEARRFFNRRYRNRRIGEFLKELHLTEGRNTGFGKILRALENNGSPKPIFETDEERTYFATTIFIHPEFLTDQTTDQTTDQAVNDSTDDKILHLIKRNPRITQAQLADKLDVPKSTIKYYVGKLSKQRVIKREGTVHNGRWIVL